MGTSFCFVGFVIMFPSTHGKHSSVPHDLDNNLCINKMIATYGEKILSLEKIK